MQEKARARLFALSSPCASIDQLSLVLPEKESKEGKTEQKGKQVQSQKTTGKNTKAPKEKQEKKEEALEPIQEWALEVLPLLNRWHTVELGGAGDNLEGTIYYYLAAEQGKINLDTLIKDLKEKAKDKEEKEEEAEKSPKQGKKDNKAAKGAEKREERKEKR